MALYNIFHGELSKQQEKEQDTFHGEYDDDEHGSVFIPHIDQDMATPERIAKLFKTNNIGQVTHSTFTRLTVPSSFKGKSKNTKLVFRATVYLKWGRSDVRKKIMGSVKQPFRVNIDERVGKYCFVHRNTVTSDELLQERFTLSELQELATECAMSVLRED